jgi:hypothetical protein
MRGLGGDTWRTRALGRLTRRWEDNIKLDIKEVVCGGSGFMWLSSGTISTPWRRSSYVYKVKAIHYFTSHIRLHEVVINICVFVHSELKKSVFDIGSSYVVLRHKLPHKKKRKQAYIHFSQVHQSQNIKRRYISCKTFITTASVVVEWLTLLLRVQEVLSSSLCLETGYSAWGFSWFFSVPQDEFRDSI